MTYSRKKRSPSNFQNYNIWIIHHDYLLVVGFKSKYSWSCTDVLDTLILLHLSVENCTRMGGKHPGNKIYIVQ